MAFSSHALKSALLIAFALFLASNFYGGPNLPGHTSLQKKSVKANLDVGHLKHGDIVPGKYIVEYNEDSGITARNHEDLDKSLASIKARRGLTYDSELFHGAVVYLKDGEKHDEHLNHVRSLRHVKSIWPVHFIETRNDNAASPANDPQESQPKSTNISESTPEALGGMYSDIFNSPRSIGERDRATVTTSENYRADDHHVQTGVRAAHNFGNTGKNVRIAILDSGIDMDHPGFKKKQLTGQAFIGDSYRQDSSAVVGNPQEQCNGRGTAMAGIILAKTDQMAIGIAPDAKVDMYRVLDCQGQTDETIIYRALDHAYKVRNNIDILVIAIDVTVSQGIARLLQQFKESGVHIVTSVDLGAQADPKRLSLITVANTRPDVAPVLLHKGKWKSGRLFTSKKDFTYSPFLTSKHASGEYILSELQGDGCIGMGTMPQMSAQSILVVAAEQCNMNSNAFSILNRIRDVKVMFHGDLREIITAQRFISTVDQNNITIGIMPSSTYEMWKSKTKKRNEPIRVSLKGLSEIQQKHVKATVYKPTYPDAYYNYAWTMSPESPWAGLGQGLQPIVSAPGENMVVLQPRAMGSYAVKSGTAYSVAYVAGCVALIFEKFEKKVEIADMMHRLITSATPLKVDSGSTDLEPVGHQGAGLINVYDAMGKAVSPLHTKQPLFSTNISTILLGSTRTVQFHPFEVCSTYYQLSSLDVKHEPAVTVKYSKATSDQRSTENSRIDGMMEVSASYTSFHLRSKECLTIVIKFGSLPTPSTYETLEYGGYIRLSAVTAGSGTHAVRIPYRGAAPPLE